MSVTTVTRFHAAAGQEATLLDLQSEGRRRMLAADGRESFDILRDQAIRDPSLSFKPGHHARHTTPLSAS